MLEKRAAEDHDAIIRQPERIRTEVTARSTACYQFGTFSSYPFYNLDDVIL